MLALIVICLGGWQEKAIAHGVKIEHQKVSAIQIEANYDSGQPMANAQVVVYAPEDPATPWLKGTTDDKGNFIFIPDPSQSGYWEVKVRQAGHGGIITIASTSLSLPVNSDTNTNVASDLERKEVPNRTRLSNSLSGENSLRKWLAIASVIWGFIGTALFFYRWKDRHPHPEEPSC
ncbi:MAG: carboxypeptidase regulatory-like domain-containing protein [Okeania sp. SIO2H7]|nr:carboxypeptidase regulatory-like domain-containing protein [Okeania sp. SIO2H7]